MEKPESQDWCPTSIFDSKGPLRESEWPAFTASLHMLVEEYVRNQAFGDGLDGLPSQLHMGIDGLAMMVHDLYQCDEFPEAIQARRRARGASCIVIDTLLMLAAESDSSQQQHHKIAIERIRATLDQMIMGTPL